MGEAATTSAEFPPEVEREFETELDAYMREWEESLRKQFGGGEGGDSPPGGGPF
jgi:hypothetical protein